MRIASTCHGSENTESEDDLPQESNVDSVTEPDKLSEGIIIHVA